MGPTSSILLNKKIGVEEIQLLDQFLESIAKGPINTTKSTRDFNVDSPRFLTLNSVGSDGGFSIYFNHVLKELQEDEIVEIELLTGQLIKSQISIAAGCNRVGDHNVLGELTLGIMRRLNGVVHFGGDLNHYVKGITEELNGMVYSISYNNGMAQYQISDTEFLTNWIQHPNFSMIK